MRGLFPLPVALLAFPSLSVLFANIGLLFGIPVSGWSGVLGFLGAALLALIGGGTYRDGLKRIGWLFVTTLAVFAFVQFFFFFSWWDAQAYHLPAAKFLCDGWNPIFDATRETLLSATGADPATFNAYHVAYLPRAGWIWSAITAKWTGNLESGDTLIVFSGLALSALAWRGAALLFGLGRWRRVTFTLLMVFSPAVVVSALAGAQDGTLYALLLIYLTAACAYRKTGNSMWLGFVAFAPMMGCNLKFTGVLSFVISGALFTIPVVWGSFRTRKTLHHLWKWMLANSIGFIFALIIGFSPYLTNWANHGGPFYPEHSFSKTEVLPEITKDFDLQNADAEQMGYVGRFTNAYISKWLAHRYYEWKLDKKPFYPIFHLNQMEGIGGGFRVAMCLALLTLCFTRRCGTPWFIIAILITSLVQPTKTVGYARYIPQFWMFPLLIAFNAMTVNVRQSPFVGRILGVLITTIMLGGSMAFAIGKMVTSLAMSIYALSMVQSMQIEGSPNLYVLSLHDRYREDGRCLAAWKTLPEGIPSPHLFDTYYHTMIPQCGVSHAHWMTRPEMILRRETNPDYFSLGEHLLYWPTDPTRIKIPDMRYYDGHPKKPNTMMSKFRFACEVVPYFPGYVRDITQLRWRQFIHNATKASN